MSNSATRAETPLSTRTHTRAHLSRTNHSTWRPTVHKKLIGLSLVIALFVAQRLINFMVYFTSRFCEQYTSHHDAQGFRTRLLHGFALILIPWSLIGP